MKTTSHESRAPSAVSRSFAARFGAWARESLLARLLAGALGLGVLAVLGGSAVAKGTAGAPVPLASASAAPPELPPAVGIAAPAVVIDAGAAVTTGPPVPAVAAADPPSVANLEAAKPRATPDDPVDLNAASASDLRRLPGVGAKRAEAILALRARLPGGRFRQLEDLLRVKGVGRTALKKLQPLVRITP
jgi:competence protein ComEA